MTRLESIDVDLEAEVFAVPLDNADIPDTLDITDDVDSRESLRLACSEGLLGGKAGDG